jgi:Arc/MetJ-type ribon-helix-helix transcriptional regulator
MSRKPTGRRNTRALNVRLDEELDVDLIQWLEAQPPGRRSEAIRDLMRDGLRARDSQAEMLMAVRQAVSEALDGLQVMAIQQGVALDANEVEDTFGAKLDQMLGGLG